MPIPVSQFIPSPPSSLGIFICVSICWNGNPLQYSCLENPRDRGACWVPSIGSHRVGHDWSDLAAEITSGTPLQYSCLENPMDGGAWWAEIHGVAFHFHALEKAMATHSSVLAWRIPGTGEPGGLLSLGLHRVRHDWSDLAAAADNNC